MTMNKNQECQENFLKIEQECNKKSSLSRKKLNIGCLETIGDRYSKNQGCEEKIKQRCNKNQGRLGTIEDRYCCSEFTALDST